MGNIRIIGIDPGLRRVLLRPGKGLPDRPGVSFENPLVATHQRQQRPAFGHGEGQVRACAVGLFVTSQANATGKFAPQDGRKCCRLDLARQSEFGSPLAQPLP